VLIAKYVIYTALCIRYLPLRADDRLQQVLHKYAIKKLLWKYGSSVNKLTNKRIKKKIRLLAFLACPWNKCIDWLMDWLINRIIDCMSPLQSSCALQHTPTMRHRQKLTDAVTRTRKILKQLLPVYIVQWKKRSEEVSGLFAPWAFRPMDVWPQRRFAAKTIRPTDAVNINKKLGYRWQTCATASRFAFQVK